MSKTIEVTYYSTPRHGYFKVSGDDARDLNISQSFSEYSYYDGDEDIFYLEEDCDATTFVETFRTKFPETQLKFKGFNSDKSSKIRGYDRYPSTYSYFSGR